MQLKELLAKAQKVIEERTGIKVSVNEIDLYLLGEKGLVPLAGDGKGKYEVYLIGNEIKVAITL
ncbi:hypothetical protein [Nitrosophilus labii]|uniref:hypothetical protein n=1 Tax=Nitrosophilus labii TaxID=2706014 RepID=UPI001656927C|nr:hypothetical protein [Nitrosophilus labii]